MSNIKTLIRKRAFRLFKIDKALSKRFCETLELFEQQFGEDHIDFDIFTAQERKQEDLHTYSSYISVQQYFLLYYDVWKHNIVIKIDKETVKNEFGLSTVIYDLFIKLEFKRSGALCYGIYYKKATFTKNQLLSHYIHSHCPRLYASDRIEWQHVCTGSGPINNSVTALANADTPLERYYGFIAELRQIVRVESLQGGPYIKIEDINGTLKERKLVNMVTLTFTNKQKEFVKSYIRSNRLKLGVINGKFCLGCSFVEWLTDLTEYAKAWGKENDQSISLVDTIVKDNKLYQKEEQYADETMLRLIGKPVITFRNKEYRIQVIDDGSDAKTKKLINPAQAASLLYRILTVLNQNYGTE